MSGKLWTNLKFQGSVLEVLILWGVAESTYVYIYSAKYG